ncbi:Gfo/Idh/MocA family oxidoreductase [Brevibacterium sp.]|uniref:Gfo/Idh/MocA family protein n=1 Tax=Brevibacterium sp. TaxID=1701 RepID=UPI00281260BF|nr:Gfo/Idh/MocA family oxidoreductase [Brevibacterium sp.]
MTLSNSLHGFDGPIHGSRDPIPTAIVGFGVAGRVFHAPLIAADDDYELEAIVTANEDRRSQAQQTHPHAALLGSFDDLIDRIDEAGDIDLVILATPPGLHREQAITLLERNISVVVDKPFAPSAADAQAIIDAAARSEGVLTVFQNRRWDGDYLSVKKLIDSGALGDVRSFESRFEWWSSRNGAPGWKDVTPVAEGGGILLDLGPHLVDQAIGLFGPVAEVSADLVRHSPGEGADEDSFVTLVHDNGVRSRLWMNRMTPVDGERFHLVGSEAGLSSRGKDPQEAQLAAGLTPTSADYGSAAGGMLLHRPGETVEVEQERGCYPEFYRLLSSAIRGDGELPVDPQDSAHVLALLDEIHTRFPVATGRLGEAAAVGSAHP